MPPEQTIQGEPTKSSGALVGAIIIVLILIIGGIYLWKTGMPERTPEVPQTEMQGTATEAELETELNSMDLESLDQDI